MSQPVVSALALTPRSMAVGLYINHVVDLESENVVTAMVEMLELCKKYKIPLQDIEYGLSPYSLVRHLIEWCNKHQDYRYLEIAQEVSTLGKSEITLDIVNTMISAITSLEVQIAIST